jgi:beta-1,4-N-acetylglucosaminyltransferase
VSTFISVGNAKQPFTRLLNAVQEVAERLPKPVTVQYGHNNFSNPAFNCVDFLKMEDFQKLVNSSELLILHGGAGSIITALQAGKRPIVMPRREELGEHVDAHQLEFVAELEKTGKIVVVNCVESLDVAIQNILDIERGSGVNNTQPPPLLKLIQDEFFCINTSLKEQ